MNSHDKLAGRIAIYARISKEERQVHGRRGQKTTVGNGSDGAEDMGSGGSTASQIYRCKQYLKSQYPEAVADTTKVYVDEGYSGKNTDRPDFHKLMGDVRHGRVQVIVFSELSRVSRSVRDFLYLVDEFRRFGVEFVSLREKFDTTSPSGRLILTILAALNEFEREQTAVRTKLNMRAKAEQGYWTGGSFAPGYKADPDRRGHLLIDEEVARIVRAVFETFLEVGSVPKTVKKFGELGLKMPAWTSSRGRHHEARPILWDRVRYMLSNPAYVGLREVNTDAKNLSPEEMEALPEGERYCTVPGKWEPIIDEATWVKVQRLRAENDRRNMNNQRRKKHDFVLTGLVFCQDCGTSLEGASSKGHTYFYYRHPRKFDCSGCAQKGWVAAEIEEAVMERMGWLAEDQASLKRLIDTANAKLVEAAPIKEAELLAAEGLVGRLEGDVQEMLAKLKAAGDKVPDTFWDAARSNQEALDTAKAAVIRLRVELDDLKAKRLQAATYREALRQFTRVYEAMRPFEKASLLRYLIERIEVNGEGVKVWLLGENPTADFDGTGGTKKNRPDSGYCQGGEWLRKRDLNSRPSG